MVISHSYNRTMRFSQSNLEGKSHLCYLFLYFIFVEKAGFEQGKGWSQYKNVSAILTSGLAYRKARERKGERLTDNCSPWPPSLCWPRVFGWRWWWTVDIPSACYCGVFLMGSLEGYPKTPSRRRVFTAGFKMKSKFQSSNPKLWAMSELYNKYWYPFSFRVLFVNRYFGAFEGRSGYS